MFVEIDEKLESKIKTFLGSDSKRMNKILNKALGKTMSYINKETKKEIKEQYDIYQGLITPGLRVYTKNGESKLLGDTKKKDMSDFYVSLMTPSRSQERLLARVRKENSKTKMRTMFWGFYKGDTSKIGLYIRLSDNRNHIARAKSVSMFQMGSEGITEDVITGANTVFNQALEKMLEKELENV